MVIFLFICIFVSMRKVVINGTIYYPEREEFYVKDSAGEVIKIEIPSEPTYKLRCIMYEGPSELGDLAEILRNYTYDDAKSIIIEITQSVKDWLDSGCLIKYADGRIFYINYGVVYELMQD